MDTVSSDDETNSFYAAFWGSRTWSGPSLNNDESVRVEALHRLITNVGATGGSALDAGCGRGVITARMAPNFDRIVGIDVTESAIKAGRALFTGLDLRHATVGELAAQGERFDTAICTEVIEHVATKDQLAFLRELHSVLRPGGILLLSTPRAELREQWTRTAAEDQPEEN